MQLRGVDDTTCSINRQLRCQHFSIFPRRQATVNPNLNTRCIRLLSGHGSAGPVPPSNYIFRRRHNSLFSNAFCVCQIDTVLHYSLRTESKTESKRGEGGEISGDSRAPWHTRNRPEPRVARGKPRNDKANREQLALNSGGLGRNRTTDTRIFSPLLYRLSYRARAAEYSSGNCPMWGLAQAALRLPRVRSTPSCLSLR